jgi:glycolate oxidase
MDARAFLAALAGIFPPSRLLSRPAEVAPYESDALTGFRAKPRG